MKLLIIPADKRQHHMTNYLNENGIECVIFNPLIGLGNSERQFDGVIFPLPSVKFSRINCEYDVRFENIAPLVKKGGFVLLAMADEKLKSEVENAELTYYDYYEREELIILNAELTAQAVLELVLINSDVRLADIKVLVTGYGKTGEAIADILNRNHAHVTVCARSSRDRARVKIRNMKAVDYREIKDIAEEFHFVINTVPELVLGKNLLSHFRDDTVFLEIASKPYGMDVGYLENTSKRLMIASSLPGKYVARSAGVFIAQTILNIVKEEIGDEFN